MSSLIHCQCSSIYPPDRHQPQKTDTELSLRSLEEAPKIEIGHKEPEVGKVAFPT